MDFVAFYLGDAPDYKGRMLAEFWKWSDERLETGHDYIQMLFPLTEQSQYVPFAPVLRDAESEEFQRNETIRKNLLISFRMMLRFYGFTLDEKERTVKKAMDFADRSANWLFIGDHNQLRITRILKCLNASGLGEFAETFLKTLLGVAEPGKVTAETLNYWKEAGRNTA